MFITHLSKIIISKRNNKHPFFNFELNFTTKFELLVTILSLLYVNVNIIMRFRCVFFNQIPSTCNFVTNPR